MIRTTSGFAAAIVAALCAAPTPSSAAVDLKVHGLLDLVASTRGEALDANMFIRGDSPFDAYGVRLFADGHVSPRLDVFTQFVLRDATSPYVDGAYLTFTPMPERDLHVLAGKIPWAIGTYAPRTYSNRNPLVSAPLIYQHHTTLVWYEPPPSADALIATAGSGGSAVNYEGYDMSRGMAIVDDSYWDVGVTVTGSERPLEYALGAVAGTPGWGSTSQDDNSGKTVLGRIGLVPYPGVRFGVSGAYGPYLVSSLDPELPQGKDANDYHQQLAMADLELLVGHAELRAEAARNVWQTPTVGDLDVNGGYAELKYSFPFGAFVAGRWDALRFGKLTDSNGVRRTWDADVDRWETGAGYRLDHDVVAKLVVQHTRLEYPRDVDTIKRLRLIAAQLSVAF